MPLRPVAASDAAAVLAAFQSSPDMARQGEVTTLAEAEAYVARLLDPDRPHHAFAVEVDGSLVGMVGITLDERNRNGWFWYWMHAEHRGGGLMTAAAREVADWALAEGGCERLELGHRVNNPASARVADAAGFVLEGREREKFLIDGERVDVLTYGRLRSDPTPARS
jgi:RimJ/RimL family protein N-acetyltransferase